MTADTQTLIAEARELDVRKIDYHNAGYVVGLVNRLADDLEKTAKRAYPETLTPPLKEALGMMSFQVIHEAQVMRDAGVKIPKKAEEEQAWFVDRFVRAVLVAGADWRKHFYDTELAPAIEAARARRPATTAE